MKNAETIATRPSQADFFGFRMMDVRMKIAAAGAGLNTVEKIDAGRYVVTTFDGRCWTIHKETPSMFWFGIER